MKQPKVQGHIRTITPKERYYYSEVAISQTAILNDDTVAIRGAIDACTDRIVQAFWQTQKGAWLDRFIRFEFAARIEEAPGDFCKKLRLRLGIRPIEDPIPEDATQSLNKCFKWGYTQKTHRDFSKMVVAKDGPCDRMIVNDVPTPFSEYSKLDTDQLDAILSTVITTAHGFIPMQPIVIGFNSHSYSGPADWAPGSTRLAEFETNTLSTLFRSAFPLALAMPARQLATVVALTQTTFFDHLDSRHVMMAIFARRGTRSVFGMENAICIPTFQERTPFWDDRFVMQVTQKTEPSLIYIEDADRLKPPTIKDILNELGENDAT